MQIALRLAQRSLRDVPAAARAAEAAGCDAMQTAENQHDPFFPLVVAASHTQRAQLWTGVAIAFPRSPMVVAHAAWDLQDAARGRFVLGLGPQVKGHNERRFSVPWSPPAPRLREYVEALRAIWRCWELGEPLRHRGPHYRFDLMTPAFAPPPTGLPMVPVTLAAVGSGLLRVAGQVADGVQLHPFCTRAYLEQIALPTLQKGLRESGLAREHFVVTGGGFVVTGPDSDTVGRIAEFVRYRVAFYASTRTYWPVLEQHDLLDLGAKLHAMSKRGEWDAMAAEISDDVLHLFAAIGTHAEIVPRIAERFGGAVDQVLAMPAPDADPDLGPDLIQEIQAIPAAFSGFRPRLDTPPRRPARASRH